MFRASQEKLEYVRDRMAKCGKSGTLYVCRENEKHRAWAPYPCDTWGCPTCEKHRMGKILKRLMPRLKKAIQKHKNGHREHALKFLTFTLPFFVQPNVYNVEHYHGLLMRYLPTRYEGGLVVFEIAPRGKDMIFLHFHAIVEGKYIPQAVLQKEWSQIIGQMSIVDVRKADEKSLNYLIKYLTKGPKGFMKDEMEHIAACFHKRQRCRSFGTLRHPVDEEPLYPSCPICSAPMKLLKHISPGWFQYYQKYEPELLAGLDSPNWMTFSEQRDWEIEWNKKHAGPYADWDAFVSGLDISHQSQLSTFGKRDIPTPSREEEKEPTPLEKSISDYTSGRTGEWVITKMVHAHTWRLCSDWDTWPNVK